MKKCYDCKCLFHNNSHDCLLSDNENYFYAKNNIVVSCINRIYNEKDLSKEGKQKLIKLTSDKTLKKYIDAFKELAK